jgi:hypothetical protein
LCSLESVNQGGARGRFNGCRQSDALEDLGSCLAARMNLAVDHTLERESVLDQLHGRQSSALRGISQ